MILQFVLILYLVQSISTIILPESTFKKQNLARNNILNKGVWVKNNNYDTFDRPSYGNYFFKPSSLDAENMLQSNYGVFDGPEQDPSITNYMDRSKRSPEYLRKHRPRTSLRTKKQINSIDEPMFTKSQIPGFKPLYNDYPFKIADKLKTDKDIQLLEGNSSTENSTANVTSTYLDLLKAYTEKNVHKNENDTKEPKMTTKYDYEVENNDLSTKVNVNATDKTERSKKSNDRFDKDALWHQNAPVPSGANVFTANNEYGVIHKDEKTRVTERGLIKVISMLTKTFKKIIKQHSEIKQIHGKILVINNDLDKKIDETSIKFQDFDSKYGDMIQFSEKLKKFEDNMIAESASLQKKQIDMDNNIAEFENQQKKFLTQQRQFYNIQKLMISQNEKINLKQNMITKAQSEISHRQNNFARILKKAKQIFYEKMPQVMPQVMSPHNTNNEDVKYNNETPKETAEPITTQEISTPLIVPSTENIKINLFSIPTKTKLENKDDLILKEKDLPIDELVYKFYFNNTFIDGLMKSKILSNFATTSNNLEIARNIKNKRDKFSTLLYPVKDSKIRNKRWINKLVKHKKKHRHTEEDSSNNLNTLAPTVVQDVKVNDPFRKMAESFCNEIGQNYAKQILEWCIEKALRRLRFMDKRVFPGTTLAKEQQKQTTKLDKNTEPASQGTSPTWLTTNYNTKVTTPTIIVTTPKMASEKTFIITPPVTEMEAAINNKQDVDIFFPDNDELELNLKKYDLTPDTEGNVYYEGSWHISDLGRQPLTATESVGMSDIMTGLADSNSKVDTLDTFTFDLQAQRRAYVRRLNTNILKHLKSG